MKRPTISIIAAIGKNRELGKNNRLLWHIPEDLARFKKLTLGHPVIMGRKTFESISKPLPQRTNIIVTRDRKYQKIGCLIANSLEQALELAKQKERQEIFIIGGGQIYAAALKYASRLYLTIVEGKYEADTYFPDYCEFKKTVFQQTGESGGYRYAFLVLERQSGAATQSRTGI